MTSLNISRRSAKESLTLAVRQGVHPRRGFPANGRRCPVFSLKPIFAVVTASSKKSKGRPWPVSPGYPAGRPAEASRGWQDCRRSREAAVHGMRCRGLRRACGRPFRGGWRQRRSRGEKGRNVTTAVVTATNRPGPTHWTGIQVGSTALGRLPPVRRPRYRGPEWTTDRKLCDPDFRTGVPRMVSILLAL